MGLFSRLFGGGGKAAGDARGEKVGEELDALAQLDARWSTETETPVGRLAHLAPVLQLSETPPRWTRPTVPLGHHRPEWPARAA